MERANITVGRHWLTVGILLLITALAAFLRFWRLGEIPPGFHYDEAYEALEAWRVLTRPGYHPIFFPGNFGVEPMYVYLTALAFRLFGETPTVMRGVAALIGTLTVPALYALVRELAHLDERIPPATPLLAAAVLAIMRWHITFSRVGIEPVLVPLFLMFLLWSFSRGMRTGSLGAWVGMGLAAGFGPYTYPAGRLLPILAALLAGLALWLRWHSSDSARLRLGCWRQGAKARTVNPLCGLIVAGCVGLLVFAPLAVQWAQHPDQLLLRSKQIVVGPPGTVAGTPAQSLLATLGMFNLRGDADPRSNVPGLPVLDLLLSIPFLLGIGLLARRMVRPVFAVWWLALAAMLVPTVFSEYAPHFRRALGAAPLVALACGLGLAMLLGRQGGSASGAPSSVLPYSERSSLPSRKKNAEMDRLLRLGRVILVAVILLGGMIYSVTAYFRVWGHSTALYYAYDQGLWEIGQYVLQLPIDERVYVTPRPATDMTLAFAWREGPQVRHFDGRHAFVAQAETSAAATYLVVEHEDFRGAQVLQALYPSATKVKTFLDREGQVYARAYRVPASARPARSPHQVLTARWPGLALVGYDLDSLNYKPGAIIYLQLWWQASAAISTDWTVFTHLLGPVRADGSTLWAGQDARPGQNSAPMTTWVAGDLVLDEHQLQVPLDAPAGVYQIEVGLYDLAASGARAVLSDPVNQDHLILGTIRVE